MNWQEPDAKTWREATGRRDVAADVVADDPVPLGIRVVGVRLVGPLVGENTVDQPRGYPVLHLGPRAGPCARCRM